MAGKSGIRVGFIGAGGISRGHFKRLNGMAGVTVTASGERAVAVGGDVSGSTIITGDGNVVGDHSRSQVQKR